ncbi:MAG: TrkA C-terminal domain-containing protein [Phycisphaerae bacterium]|nr:TrkA C-terminal domain-containing protein [Phycisphaerae bacterium]
MGAVISLLLIAAVSLAIVRLGSKALVLTGLSWDVASFQAYSAFFGVGFTTAEAELAVSTPHRRRIIKHLILTGNLGLTAGLGSVIVAFVKADGLRAELHVLLSIVVGLIGVALISITPPFRRVLDWAIGQTLKHAGVLHAADFSLLLRLHAGYNVSEVTINANTSVVARTLAESKLGSRGIVVLGITRRNDDGREEYIGTPHGTSEIRIGDILTLYGRPERIAELVR